MKSTLPKSVRDAIKVIANTEIYQPDDKWIQRQDALLRVYFSGMRNGVNFLVKETEWTPEVKAARAEIRRKERKQ